MRVGSDIDGSNAFPLPSPSPRTVVLPACQSVNESDYGWWRMGCGGLSHRWLCLTHDLVSGDHTWNVVRCGSYLAGVVSYLAYTWHDEKEAGVTAPPVQLGYQLENVVDDDDGGCDRERRLIQAGQQLLISCFLPFSPHSVPPSLPSLHPPPVHAIPPGEQPWEYPLDMNCINQSVIP